MSMVPGEDECVALAERLIEDDPELFMEQLAVSHQRLQEILSGE